jgi:hypothetical protein
MPGLIETIVTKVLQLTHQLEASDIGPGNSSRAALACVPLPGVQRADAGMQQLCSINASGAQHAIPGIITTVSSPVTSLLLLLVRHCCDASCRWRSLSSQRPPLCARWLFCHTSLSQQALRMTSLTSHLQ